MKDPSIAELKQMARETFGRDLSDSEATAYRKRLPTMVRAVNTLRDRESGLRDCEPALVHCTPVQPMKTDDAS
ncbi:MAG: hypothetical protein ACE5NW_12085 [Acidiferrobacterales bacterium]